MKNIVLKSLILFTLPFVSLAGGIIPIPVPITYQTAKNLEASIDKRIKNIEDSLERIHEQQIRIEKLIASDSKQVACGVLESMEYDIDTKNNEIIKLSKELTRENDKLKALKKELNIFKGAYKEQKEKLKNEKITC